MTKHTQGPWHVAAGTGIYDRHNRLIAAIHSPLPQPCEANARLIAAAPDLLEALEEAAASLEDAGKREAAGMARVAIAKATDAGK